MLKPNGFILVRESALNRRFGYNVAGETADARRTGYFH